LRYIPNRIPGDAVENSVPRYAGTAVIAVGGIPAVPSLAAPPAALTADADELVLAGGDRTGWQACGGVV
jgi:hypothetical protein